MPKTHGRSALELMTLAILASVAVVQSGVYNELSNASLCINANFVKGFPLTTNSLLCDETPSCRGFSVADGWCQLFVFDACSCSRRGQAFVKQQPGLAPGALCPSGYGDDLCGVKYKMYSGTGYWQPSRQKCESESGLVIMADVIDTAEMNHVDMLYSKYNLGLFWLGGYQTPGSAEPAGGWHWVACNIALNPGLWGSGENTAVIKIAQPSRADYSENSTTPTSVLCECVSPFVSGVHAPVCCRGITPGTCVLYAVHGFFRTNELQWH